MPCRRRPAGGYGFNVIPLLALIAPCPTGVKLPFAVSFILLRLLSRMRPLPVRTSVTLATPVFRNETLAFATSTVLPWVATRYHEITRRPRDGAENANE